MSPPQGTVEGVNEEPEDYPGTLTTEQRQARLELLAAALGPARNRATRRAMIRAKVRADRRAGRSQ